MLAALTLTPCLDGQPASIDCDHGLVVPLRVCGNDMKENGLLPKRRLTTAILPFVGGGSRATQGCDDLGGGVVGKVRVETHGRRIHGKNKSAMRKIKLAQSPHCGQGNAISQPHQMNRDAKNISSSLRPQIEMTKGHIRNSGGKWFDADGYVGKTAIKELRAAGWEIKYNKDRGSYRTMERAVA